MTGRLVNGPSGYKKTGRIANPSYQGLLAALGGNLLQVGTQNAQSGRQIAVDAPAERGATQWWTKDWFLGFFRAVWGGDEKLAL
jgi:hypothetical protein